MRKVLVFLIKCYQKGISPFLGPSCRFHPTCSSYAIEALEKYGFFRGSYLSLRRVLRCHPFCEGGLDPVPDLPQDRRKKEQ